MIARDGGPAFARPAFCEEASFSTSQTGMSVRQLYKMHAQQLVAAVIFADPRGGSPGPEEVAKLCATFADAQLAEDAEFAAKGGQP